jgi:hypothetical protein
MMLAATAILAATVGATGTSFIGGLVSALTRPSMAPNTNVPAVQVTAAQYLIGRALPIEGAIAIACVLYCESKLNPGSQGTQSSERGGELNPKGAFGIASWNGPRQGHLAKFAKARGMDVNLLTTQLYFVLNECANSYPLSWAAIRSANPAETIIATFVADYENPLDHQAEIDRARVFAAPLRAALHAQPGPIGLPPVTPDPVPWTLPPITPLPQGPTQMPTEALLALIIQIGAPIIQSIVSAVLHAHGIKPQGAPPPVVVAPPVQPAQIDPAALEQMIAAILAKLTAAK